jgi:predicted secreted acid phosphatase/exonuclease III
VATWNVEHLAFPATDGCRARSQEELAQLKDYAESLSADIVALQEVASVEAVDQIFPSDEWQIVISERTNSEAYTCRESGVPSTQQKVGYAVKKAISIESVNSLAELGIKNPGLRHGLELKVSTEFGSLSLLNVHMKSGCFVDDFARSDSDACVTFAEQAPVLDAWVEQSENAGLPYAVLGDFNHRLSAPYNRLTQLLHTNSDGSESSLEITTQGLIGCHPYYPAPIDHIIVGHFNASKYQMEASVHPFENMNPDRMLSDHCAVSLDISTREQSLSTAVKWLTTSAEYRFMTEATYQSAIDTIQNTDFGTGWTVVMDVDETILDNSAYQVNLDLTGGSFTAESWDQWVMSKQAKLVPGSKAFIEAVIENGGTLSFVTNRNRELDEYTWDNLTATGLPINIDNTCLMGRADQDQQAMGQDGIINDKDLRRLQVESGRASCFAPSQGRHDDFAPARIVMQVGDNIEDVRNVTQEHADVDELLNNRDTLILLPNPMYGSW